MNSSRTNILDQAADRVFCVIGAFLLNQFPGYMGQYMELLSKISSGKVNAAVLIEKKKQEVTILDLVLKNLKDFGLEISTGRTFANQGERIQFYRSAINDFGQATSIEKPFIFLSRLDFNVVSYMDYTSVLQKDMQSLVYAFFGIFLGAIAYKILVKSPYYLFIAKEKKTFGRKRKGPKFA